MRLQRVHFRAQRDRTARFLFGPRYAPTLCCYAMSGMPLLYAAMPCPVPPYQMVPARSTYLPTACAVLAARMLLLFAAMPREVLRGTFSGRGIPLRVWCYAVCGTELAYAPTTETDTHTDAHKQTIVHMPVRPHPPRP
eukprot:530101-Rhodomonas_salina.1